MTKLRPSASTAVVRIGRVGLRVVWTHAGVALVDEADELIEDIEERLRMRLVKGRMPPLIREALQAAGRGHEFDVPVDLSWETEYAQEVIAAAMRIPRGQTRSYAWLAREARRPLAIRAAASVMARNPLWLLVPCHRVIASDGTIGSYGSSGVARKRALLAREGVRL